MLVSDLVKKYSHLSEVLIASDTVNYFCGSLADIPSHMLGWFVPAWDITKTKGIFVVEF